MGSHKSLFSQSRQLFWVFFLSSILLLGGVLSGHVFAQGDEAATRITGAEDPIDQKQKQNLASINSILRAGNFSNDQQKDDFDKYYNTYAFPRWTQQNALGKPLSEYHKELSSHLRQAKSGQVHDHLNELALAYMNKLAKSNKYHPVVRYNAMLTIGELNSVESTSQSPPLADALPVLLAAVNDANQIEPVKIAALIGINRQVSPPGLNNPQLQKDVLTAMLKVAVVARSAEDATPGQQWMRMQAIEILGLLGVLGNNNQVVQVLAGAISDSKATFSVRCAAAEALGKLKLAEASGLNAASLAKTLGKLMLDACSAELKSVKETGTPVSRRRMKTRLSAAMEGLEGLKPLAKDQAQMEELQKILDDLLKDLDNSRLADAELQKTAEGCQAKLKAWVEKRP